MTHFLSTSAGLAENVLIFASMNGIAPAKAGALRAYLSALGSWVNSGETVFRHYFNEVDMRYYLTVNEGWRVGSSRSRSRGPRARPLLPSGWRCRPQQAVCQV